MATELNIYPYMQGEVASGPASIANTFTAPAITYSAPNFTMTLSPMKYGAVEYYDNPITPASTPAAFFTKNGSVGASDMIEITADATNINAAIGGGTAKVHALLIHAVSGTTTYYFTLYVTQTNFSTLVNTIASLPTWTTDAIIQNVFNPHASPPGSYTYDANALAVYTLIGMDTLTTPIPLVYVNGVLKTVTTDYLWDGGIAPFYAFITFNAALAATDVVTATYQWLHACADNENVSVFEFDKEPNIVNQKDVNGYRMVTEGYNKYTGYVATLTWPYATYAWYRQLKAIAESAGSTIDVERVSLYGTVMERINDLYITSFPKWSDEPGVVSVVKDVSILVVEL